MYAAPLKNLVIVGGGSAGWMTAAMLSSQLGNSVQLTLVESDDIGTIGVGEATIPPIKRFNMMLGIDENEFLRQCNGSIKLGIQFENWAKPGDSYFHQFGRFGLDFDYIPFPYFFLKAQLDGHNLPIQEYSLAWQLAKLNKFTPPSTDARSLFSGYDYAYHFDASRYATFLRHYSEKRGVLRKEGKVTAVTQHLHTGNIKELVLADGSTLSADFFIDCSGSRALLLGDTLNVGFTSWKQYLLNDSAIAVQTSLTEPIRPYTRSIAHQAGWQWRIPLQTRMGNGNVFSSEHLSTDAAQQMLLNDVSGTPLNEPRLIRFNTGHRQQFWHKNCLAIGLSAGFLEPLESTSLHLIQRGIMRFISLFPGLQMNDAVIQEYNQLTQAEYQYIRDFIILHYHATNREDSAYWQYCKHMAIPASLSERLSLYRQYGHLRAEDKDIFKQESWVAVLTGQRTLPAEIAPVMQAKHAIDLDKTLAALHQQLKSYASTAVGHEFYLSKYCAYSPN